MFSEESICPCCGTVLEVSGETLACPECSWAEYSEEGETEDGLTVKDFWEDYDE